MVELEFQYAANVIEALNGGQSVFSMIPRHYGLQAILAKTHEDAMARGQVVVPLSSAGEVGSGRLSWSGIWELLCAKCGLGGGDSVTHPEVFRRKTRELLRETAHHLFVTVEGASPSNLENHALLVRELDSALREAPKTIGVPRLQVMVVDDYSTYFFYRRHAGQASHPERMKFHWVQRLSLEELERLVGHRFAEDKPSAEMVRRCGDRITEVLGGHPALTRAALLGASSIDELTDQCALGRFAEECSVFARLASDLAAAEYPASVADRFSSPGFLQYGSRSEEALVRLGVLALVKNERTRQYQ